LDQLGTLVVLFQKDFHGQITTEREVPTFEDDAHAAPGDLTKETEPRQGTSGWGHPEMARLFRRLRQTSEVGAARCEPGNCPQRDHGEMSWRSILVRVIRPGEPPARQAADQGVERPLTGRAAADVIVDSLGIGAVELITEEPQEGRLIRAVLEVKHRGTPR
jgi:hypothetical protein